MTKREIGVLAVRIMALLLLLRGSQMLFFAAGFFLEWISSGSFGLRLPYYYFQVLPFLILAPVFWFGAERIASLICTGGDLDADAVYFASNREVSALAFALFGLYTIYSALPYFVMFFASMVETLFNPHSGRMWIAEVGSLGGYLLQIVIGTYLLFNSGSFVNWIEVRKKK